MNDADLATARAIDVLAQCRLKLSYDEYTRCVDAIAALMNAPTAPVLVDEVINAITIGLVPRKDDRIQLGLNLSVPRDKIRNGEYTTDDIKELLKYAVKDEVI